jgi:hypothetical protein
LRRFPVLSSPPLLGIALVAAVGTRWAIGLSVIPGLLAALAIVYAIRHTSRPHQRERQPVRLQVRPVLRGALGRLMVGVTAFELGNCAATLLILRDGTVPHRSAASPTVAFLFLAAAMGIAVPLIATTGGTAAQK